MDMLKLKKYLKRNSACFILLLLSVGLVQCVDKSLHKNDIPWYNEGDTLLFKSESDTHTFVVEEVSCGSDYSSENGNSWDRHFTKVQQINCSDTCCIYTTAITTLEQYCNINGERFILNYSNSGYSLKVGRFFVNNLYRRDLKYYRENPPYCIQTVYFHINYGLVAYELVNGDKYVMEEYTFYNLFR